MKIYNQKQITDSQFLSSQGPLHPSSATSEFQSKGYSMGVMNSLSEKQKSGDINEEIIESSSRQKLIIGERKDNFYLIFSIRFTIICNI